jgi:molybdopterin-guanine dinucleotide biosynthesis protein A
MYQYLIDIISQACPELDTIYMSVKNEDVVPPSEMHSNQSKGTRISVEFIYDNQYDESADSEDIGPAAGLLAAYCSNPETNWLVVACDFPLLKVRTLQRLVSAQESQSASLTCYRNSKGFCEPLLAVWSPEALEKLAGNVRQGRTGPRFVVDELPDARIINPEDEVELFNVNTFKEWEQACNLFESLA